MNGIPDWLQRLVDKANAKQAVMDGTTGPAYQILDGADVVSALWPDHSAPYGVAHLIIKGESFLRVIAEVGVALPGRTTAIWCANAEQAHALKIVRGEPKRHDD